MSDRFRSIFIYGCSVWEAAHYLLSKAEPFRSELKTLRQMLPEIRFAQVMVHHPWRPKPELPGPWHNYTEDDRTDLLFNERLRLRVGQLIDFDDEDEPLPQDLPENEGMDPGQTD